MKRSASPEADENPGGDAVAPRDRVYEERLKHADKSAVAPLSRQAVQRQALPSAFVQGPLTRGCRPGG